MHQGEKAGTLWWPKSRTRTSKLAQMRNLVSSLMLDFCTLGLTKFCLAIDNNVDATLNSVLQPKVFSAFCLDLQDYVFNRNLIQSQHNSNVTVTLTVLIYLQAVIN